MLNLIKSNRMENLARALCTVIGDTPGNPLSPEFIGIQSRGMKQWLSQVIARHFGICANVRFMFPRQMLEYIREHSCESQGAGLTESGFLNRDMMAWAVLDALMTKASKSNQSDSRLWGPETYLEHDDTGTKAMALSRRIAVVLDDYQVYRPDMLAAWGRGDNQAFEDPHALWQAALWQDLINKGISLPDQMQACIAALESGAVNPMALPRRISLFGISAMPPFFLNLFNRLGRNMDVFLFLLTPTHQFYFDLPSPRQQEKAALKNKALSELPEEGNPLLGALGQSSRETQGLLENFDYDEPMGDLFADPVELGVTDMLSVIQSDILNLVWRGRGRTDAPMAISPGDNSLAVHACHSPMREAQVLKDLILDAFNNDPGLCPHDVVVMMPDIEASAPFLEAVFSQSPALPFTVSDRRRRSESLTISAFLNILEIKETRLEKSKIMGLLSCPVIADKFGLTMGDQEVVSALFDAAGILWGKDGAHRHKILGQPYEHNSWTFGLNRLMTGFALPEASAVFVNDVLPCDGIEGLEGEILGKCAHFIHSLFKALELMDSPGTVQAWATRFRTIIADMLVKDLGNDGDMAVLLNALDDMEKEANQAEFERQVSFSAVRLALTAKLDVNISQGSFLAGGITFCNLMPMRSIPFKLVCLMGMDAQSFPRTGSSPGFDLIRQYPRLGDEQDRLEDCELFLEALLCARLRLIITYTGMHISDNTPVPVASPVAELIDTVENSFIFPQGFQWQFTHPLHPFSPVYFSNTGVPGYFSYSNAQCRICSSRRTRNNGNNGHGDKAAGVPDSYFRNPTGDNVLQHQVSEEAPMIALADLIAFFRHPVQYYVTGTLGVSYPEPGEETDEREPFRLSGRSLYQLGSLAVSNRKKLNLYPMVKAQGRLPFGKKGEQEWARINDLAEPVTHLAQNECPDGEPRTLEICLQTDACCITGRVTDVYDQGRAVAGFGRLNPSRLLTQWIIHLAYACVEDHPGPTVMVGQDPQSRKPAVKFEFYAIAEKSRAQALLRDLAGDYLDGKARIFPFFADLCFQLVLDLSSRDYDLSTPSLAKALSKCAGLWRNNFSSTGESFNRYTTLVFGQDNPFSDPLALEHSGVLDAGLAVYRPMLEHLIS
ncbi:exodeoxyribonuclease V subunit gamma [Desulfobacter latus]|uniref:Exodeoxyribonuclease V subunit gamma n=1 Tax=Desulfobacter latus TaxID=2292 RepID=A0A850T777_9BACT|nr:exodeoxyribonuclease V subunit gamma [Desulfobacter latus]NWH04238.1 exodeoxyribonuclease V subunit gamma [Desulfobacter latus]